jgi:hypothetical protein
MALKQPTHVGIGLESRRPLLRSGDLSRKTNRRVIVTPRVLRYNLNWWQEESMLKAYAPLCRSSTEKIQVGNLPVEVGNLPRGVEKKD